jgi:outer membrane protein
MKFYIVCLFILALIYGQLSGQQTRILTLQEALKLAETYYPSILAREFNVKANESNVSLQKLDWLPRLDVNIQADKSTLNNIYGLYYPQDIILPISGPVKTDNNYQPIWGSAAGLLLSWQPIMFGERRARIKLANSELKIASDDLTYEIFNQKIKLIDTWLDYLAAMALMRTQYANLERTMSIYRSIKVFSIKGLKPGVDSLIAEIEVSKAREGLNRAKETLEVYKYNIAQQLALTDTLFSIPAQNFFTDKPAPEIPVNDSLNTNPSLILFRSQLEAANAKMQLVKHSYHPKISIYESSFARGSGADINGNNDYSMNGLAFSKYNYALGLTITLPILQLFPIRSQIKIQQNNISKQESLTKEQELKLNNEQRTGRIHIQTAIQNYAESQIQYRAASASFSQMKVRYTSGLVTLPELFQTQYEFNRAESESSIANLTIWKALLFYVQASGEIDSFLNQVK